MTILNADGVAFTPKPPVYERIENELGKCSDLDKCALLICIAWGIFSRSNGEDIRAKQGFLNVMATVLEQS